MNSAFPLSVPQALKYKYFLVGQSLPSHTHTSTKRVATQYYLTRLLQAEL